MELAVVILVVLTIVAGVGAYAISAARGRDRTGTDRRSQTRPPPRAPSTRPPKGRAESPPPRDERSVEPTSSGGGFRRDGLGAKVRSLFGAGAGDDTWKELEDLLLKADVGPAGSAELVARVRETVGRGGEPLTALREQIVAMLGADGSLSLPGDRPGIVLVVGVNGAGKTTTIGKLASQLGSDGKQVTVAAADTYRAAAGEQLEVWASRAGAHLVGQDRGADPGAVAFDAVRSATARGSDVVLIDTAGRLHTKSPLMDELGKVKRVVEKAGGTVDETLLVLDAQTGQNGIAQARAFTQAVDVTGVVLTKTDGSAKGGIVLAVRTELGVPVRFVGVGEAPDDLRPFEATAFADRLLSG